MNFFNPNKPSATAAAPPSQPQHPLQQAFTSLQTHFSNFFHNLQPSPPLKSPFFAKISNENSFVNSRSNGGTSSFSANNYAMSAEAIEERLAGVPVYALSNGEKFVLVSGTNTGKNLGLFCFSEADAGTLLKHMKSVDPSMSSGSQVVAVALSKIFQLDVDGVALRLMPEASQIRNALTERKKAGIPDESFAGVPVFQGQMAVLVRIHVLESPPSKCYRINGGDNGSPGHALLHRENAQIFGHVWAFEYGGLFWSFRRAYFTPSQWLN
ncbi:UNVERIFIED_CONTAM: protein -like, chloroplastic [Sesamum radiatum]|uniref:Protein -like, chloroplastic n=1 Tax=Sesamum radiatum TaxID=300843 RepID=A0AAW2TJE2_SESRA